MKQAIKTYVMVAIVAVVVCFSAYILAATLTGFTTQDDPCAPELKEYERLDKIAQQSAWDLGTAQIQAHNYQASIDHANTLIAEYTAGKASATCPNLIADYTRMIAEQEAFVEETTPIAAAAREVEEAAQAKYDRDAANRDAALKAWTDCLAQEDELPPSKYVTDYDKKKGVGDIDVGVGVGDVDGTVTDETVTGVTETGDTTADENGVGIDGVDVIGRPCSCCDCVSSRVFTRWVEFEFDWGGFSDWWDKGLGPLASGWNRKFNEITDGVNPGLTTDDEVIAAAYWDASCACTKRECEVVLEMDGPAKGNWGRNKGEVIKYHETFFKPSFAPGTVSIETTGNEKYNTISLSNAAKNMLDKDGVFFAGSGTVNLIVNCEICETHTFTVLPPNENTALDRATPQGSIPETEITTWLKPR